MERSGELQVQHALDMIGQSSPSGNKLPALFPDDPEGHDLDTILQEKTDRSMVQWKLPDSRVAAFIDIGTNSLRLLLVRINPNHSYSILSDQKEIVRLGEGEFIDQYMRPEAMQRAALVAKRFSDMARSYGAEDIIAVANLPRAEAETANEFLRGSIVKPN
jgi:hypothetical protein